MLSVYALNQLSDNFFLVSRGNKDGIPVAPRPLMRLFSFEKRHGNITYLIKITDKEYC
jgi:hypothetical protein